MTRYPQALAAVGQLHLMRHYDDNFTALGKRCAQVRCVVWALAVRTSLGAHGWARTQPPLTVHGDTHPLQVLITVDNIIERHQYLNVRATFKALFDYDCIPIGASPLHAAPSPPGASMRPANNLGRSVPRKRPAA